MAHPARCIDLNALTSFAIHPDGRDVEIGFLDASDKRHILRLTPEALGGLFAAIPGMLEVALQRLTGNPNTKQVFELADWKIVPSTDGDMTLFTLCGARGFHVTFATPFPAAERLALELATTHKRASARSRTALQ
jgi:hypothetical protein